MFKDFVSKFETLVENQKARMENDGFLIGDYVEFRKSFNPEKHPWTARRGERYLQIIHAFMKDGLPLRVAEMYTENPPEFAGRADGLDARSAPRILSIYQENIPAGRIGGEILPVPAEAMNVVDHGNNWSPEHDWAREEKVTIKPEEVKSGDENHNNPKSNKTIPSSSAHDPKIAKAQNYKQ